MSTSLHEASLHWQTHTVHTWRLQPEQLRQHSPTVVMMHGAGSADSSRAKGLAQAFADCGVRVISLDFIGHGRSTGAVRDMSLAQRTEVARAAIEHWTMPTDKLILCGFSMSGHTALRLTERLGDRVQALSLMAPGIYAAEAEQVLFTEDFSKIIRQENSWQNSLAFQNAEQFTGRVHLLMSNHDEVIPWGVAEHLLRAFRQNAAEVRFDVLAEPDHKVASWLSERPERGHDIMHYLLGR